MALNTCQFVAFENDRTRDYWRFEVVLFEDYEVSSVSYELQRLDLSNVRTVTDAIAAIMKVPGVSAVRLQEP